MHVKPVTPGLKVRDPERSAEAKRTAFLPADGGEVPDNDYWRDRLAAGDVVTGDGSAPAPQTAPVKAPAAKPRAKKAPKADKV